MRQFSLAIICLVTILPVPTVAQDFELSGYAEHQVFPQKVQSNTFVLDYSKFRLDVSADFGTKIALVGDYVIQIQQGKRDFNSLDLIPRRVVEEYSRAMGASIASLERSFRYTLEDARYVDNAHVTLYSRPVNLRGGRQQLPWGTGWAWNPTDIFHDKNALDPTYEKKGVDAMKMEIPLGGMSMITGVFGVGDGWTKASKAIRIKSHVRGFDFSLSLMEKYEAEVNVYTIQQTNLRRRLIAGDFSGALLGLGVWFEGAYNLTRTFDLQTTNDSDRTFENAGADGTYTQALLGVDYTLESGTYLVAEYYRNGRGRRRRKDYNMNDWMRLLGRNGENLGRNYLFIGESRPLSDLLNGSVFAIINFDDGSVVLYPYLDYSLSSDASLTLIAYVTLGRQDAEFGAFGSGLILRGRWYF